MASIAEYQQDIARYRRLKDQLRGVISNVRSAAGRTGSLDLEIRSSYQVNGDDAAISGRVADLKRELEDTTNFLDGTVMPSIDSSIDYAEREIERLEEEERRRREEEERRRQEEEEEERKRQEESAA